VEDTVQVRCTKCKGSFRDQARRIQSGYSRQCPNCEVIIFFEEGAIDRNVQRAMRDAKRLRRALRAADEIRPSAPREYVHRR
jgi:NAD-dependent SIR2 family protein deacetylase